MLHVIDTKWTTTRTIHFQHLCHWTWINESLDDIDQIAQKRWRHRLPKHRGKAVCSHDNHRICAQQSDSTCLVDASSSFPGCTDSKRLAQWSWGINMPTLGSISRDAWVAQHYDESAFRVWSTIDTDHLSGYNPWGRIRPTGQCHSGFSILEILYTDGNIFGSHTPILFCQIADTIKQIGTTVRSRTRGMCQDEYQLCNRTSAMPILDYSRKHSRSWYAPCKWRGWIQWWTLHLHHDQSCFVQIIVPPAGCIP